MTTQPYFMRQPEPWVNTSVERSHREALYAYGEYAIFVLLWNAFDLEAERVARCPECFVAYGEIARTYGQSAKNECRVCYGTSFEGGYRARVVRPTLWQDRQTDKPRNRRRGTVETDSMSVETTSDLTLHTNDLVFRGDGTRYQITVPNAVEFRTGFEATGRNDTSVGINVAQVRLEDTSSVAYSIPPDRATVVAALGLSRRFPADFSAIEDIRGPLLV